MRVSGAGFTEASVAAIENGFKAWPGRDVQIIVDRLTETAPEKPGPFGYVVSRVAEVQTYL